MTKIKIVMIINSIKAPIYEKCMKNVDKTHRVEIFHSHFIKFLMFGHFLYFCLDVNSF